MKVLMVHNSYLESGGEDASTQAELAMLRRFGHEVDLFHEHNTRIAELGAVRTAMRTVWSAEAHRRVRALLASGRHHVMHVQNFFPLISPSIHHAAHGAGVPVVQALRNYRLSCLPGVFFRDGSVCEACLGRAIGWRGVWHGCYRGTRAGSAVVAGMLTAHRLLGTWHHTVDAYVVPTEFAKRKFLEAGLPADRMHVKPNFVHPDPGVGEGRGGYALYVGRLSAEKGIETLLRAWPQIGDRLPLRVVGTGPLADRVQTASVAYPFVQWLGSRSAEEVGQLTAAAAVLIFPSECYETFGRVAIEAFATGTPVVTTNHGAGAEIVEDGLTGLHFRPGDADDLAETVAQLLARPRRLAEMRRAARAEFEAKYHAEENYARLAAIYQQAVERHRSTM